MKVQRRDATVGVHKDSEFRILGSPFISSKTRIVKYLRVRQDFYPNVLGISPSQLANGDDVTFFFLCI